MNGAESLVRTLLNGGVNTCFMNPGTSEMHFVSALDDYPEMRSILCLFEGVVSGAADGYTRLAEKPAASLLHLGPGLGNGIANLHNAKKAYSPMVNIVGQHSTRHLEYDAPLTADIEGLAWPVSNWVKTSENSISIASDGAAAIAASMGPPGGVATLILPANTAWGEADGPAETVPSIIPESVPADRITEIANLIRQNKNTVLLIGDRVMGDEKLGVQVSKIANAYGVRMMSSWYAAKVRRGASMPMYERLQYAVDKSLEMLAGTQHIIRIGARDPIAFFAYPNKPSRFAPPNCEDHILVDLHEDIPAAIEALLEELEAGDTEPILAPSKPAKLPQGDLDPDSVWMAITALMPENSIVSDESVTASRMAGPITQSARPHDWLHVTGGSIGQGLPVATGAAIAAPDRQVFAMEADGSAMYTLQALWTQARESLNVVNVIFNNQSYKILEIERKALCAKESGPQSDPMLSIGNPELNFVDLAKGMGVPAKRVNSSESFVKELQRGIDEPGPYLIEAMIS